MPRSGKRRGMAARETDNPFVSYAFLSALEDSGSVGGAPAGTRAMRCCAMGRGEIAAVAPCYAKTNIPTANMCSTMAGPMRFERAGRALLSEIAGGGAVLARCRGRGCCARASTCRRWRAALEACEELNCSSVACDVLHRSGMGGAGRGGVAATARHAVPLGE